MSPEPPSRRPRRGRRAPTVYTGPRAVERRSEVPPESSIEQPDSQGTLDRGPAEDGIEDLVELLELSDLDCPKRSLPRLQRYLVRMLEENEKLNLSGIRDMHEALALHVVDSLFLWTAIAKPPKLILDIGSGNGFPGVAAASLWPGARVILVERRQKKSAAISACAQAAGMTNVECLALDAGQLPSLHAELRRSCDLVLSRATASLAEIAKLASPLLRREGLLVQWKAMQFPEEERKDYERQQKQLQLQSREDLIYVIHAAEPRPRRLVSAIKI